MMRSSFVAVVSGLMVCGSVLGQDKAPPPASPPANAAVPVEVAGQPEKKNTPKLAAGAAAPSLTIEKWVKGDPIAGFEKGKIYIVEFWAVWAPQAATLFPKLSALQQEFAGKGVTIIGVASKDKRNNTLERVEKMVLEKGDSIGYSIAWDVERTTSTAWLDAAEAPFIPWAFVVDKDGKIAFDGNPHEFDFGLVVDRLLDGTWDIAKGPAALSEINAKTEETLRVIEPRTSTQPREAWKEFQAFEAKYPRPARAVVPASIKADLMIRNEAADAYMFARAVVDRLIAEDGRPVGIFNRRSWVYLNQIAWAIVDPKGGVKKKDLDLAMKAASAAAKQTGERDAAILDTLARVYWLKDDKIKAVELQKKAIKLIGEDEPDLKKELEANLREYQGIKS